VQQSNGIDFEDVVGSGSALMPDRSEMDEGESYKKILSSTRSNECLSCLAAAIEVRWQRP
jgi:hypothetical protein